MNQLLNALKELGLSETETTTYLTGLSYETISVQELEKQTGIKRTTLYHALTTLGAKGLVSHSSVGGVRLVYSMAKPERLLRITENKMEKLKTEQATITSLIPLLNNRQPSQEEDIQVRRFNGIEGVKTAIDEALYAKNRHWDIIAPKNNFLFQFNKEYSHYFMETRSKRGITTRALWEKSDLWRPLTSEEISTRRPRFLPDSMTGHFHTLIILFDKSILYISSLNNASAIIVESSELFGTMSGIFESLWSISEEYNKTDGSKPVISAI
jgi:sugar-specific transcriptional regulator TrmB